VKYTKYAFIVLIIFIFVWSVYGEEKLKPLNVRVALLDISRADGDDKSSIEFLALRRIFNVLGIPYDILIDTSKMSNYKVVYSGGALTNAVLSSKNINAIYDYVEDGGVFVSAGEVGSRFNPLFGIKHRLPGRRRYRLTFTGNDDSLRYINHPSEQTISLGNGEKHFYDEVIWSHGYQLTGEAEQLAIFDDEITGFSVNLYTRGKTYLFGLSYTESVLRPQIGEDYEAQRRYVNSFEPSADVIMLILKAIYESNVTPFVYLSTSPYSRSTALILSHDVDAQTSFVDSLKYADLEHKYGVKSTFFVNTKYFVDWMDIDYYNIKENVQAIRELKRRGWDIGSHSVSHYKMFSLVPEGDPGVTFKSYDPVNQVTVQGEVRVSKELLDRDIPDQTTKAFRASGLEFPNELIKVLEEAGYLYDSTFSANDVLTAFPFRALGERHLGSPESSILEIPVTLDDSMGYLTAGSVDRAVEAWIEIAMANMENEAITVLLVHPSDTRIKTYKLEAQEGLMKEILKLGGWIGDLTTFGEFWNDRDNIEFKTYMDDSGTLVIEIDRSRTDLNPMIGFVVEKSQAVKRIKVRDSNGSFLNYSDIERNGKLWLGTQAGLK